METLIVTLYFLFRLLTPEDRTKWRGVRTVGQLKRELKIKAEPNSDHLYIPVERKPKVFNDLKINKNLQKQLPYRLKPKTVAEKERKIENERVAVVLEPQERKLLNQMKMMRTVFQV